MRREAPLLSGALALACVTLAYAPAALADHLEFERHAIFSGEIWRLWSAHLVHFSTPHALGDAAVLFVLGALLEKEIGPRRLGGAMALGALFISSGLLFWAPDMAHYRGASGLAMMAAALAGAQLWANDARAPRRVALAALGLGLVVKTAGDALGWSGGWSNLPAGVALAWQAHALGAACGALMTLRATPSAGGGAR